MLKKSILIGKGIEAAPERIHTFVTKTSQNPSVAVYSTR
jgi:hypothetical protein